MSLQHNSENCALIASFSFPRPGSVGLKSSLDSLESFGKAFRGAANRSGVLLHSIPSGVDRRVLQLSHARELGP